MGPCRSPCVVETPRPQILRINRGSRTNNSSVRWIWGSFIHPQCCSAPRSDGRLEWSPPARLYAHRVPIPAVFGTGWGQLEFAHGQAALCKQHRAKGSRRYSAVRPGQTPSDRLPCCFPPPRFCPSPPPADGSTGARLRGAAHCLPPPFPLGPSHWLLAARWAEPRLDRPEPALPAGNARQKGAL